MEAPDDAHGIGTETTAGARLAALEVVTIHHGLTPALATAPVVGLPPLLVAVVLLQDGKPPEGHTWFYAGYVVHVSALLIESVLFHPDISNLPVVPVDEHADVLVGEHRTVDVPEVQGIALAVSKVPQRQPALDAVLIREIGFHYISPGLV